MVTRWTDLVDPTHEELQAALPAHVDPDVVDALLAATAVGREPLPLLESHGSYVFGVLVAMGAGREGGTDAQEIDFVATPERLVTVRKTTAGGTAYDPGALHPSHDGAASVGMLVYRLVDDVADSYLELLNTVYAEIDDLEDRLDSMQPAHVRLRLSEIRHELLRRRRMVSATRAAVRRVLDGRVEVGEHGLFPPEIESLFGDTYDTLVRATEELDIARDLLAGARDHLQAKVAETQNEVGKKLTVIASLVLVPSFIVGFYGQNFEGVFSREYWSIGVSTSLIAASTLVQLALFRWRRWI